MARRRTGFQKKIEQVHWTLGVISFNNQAAGSIAATMINALSLPETLLRIRGSWATAFTGVSAGGIGVGVTVGIIQVPEGTGSTVLWSPFTDGNAPWIWWDVMHLMYTESVVDVTYSTQTSSGRRVIDSKAMRKNRNMELQVVLEATTLAGMSAANINAVGTVRVLSGS